jgi:hypothetical protein
MTPRTTHRRVQCHSAEVDAHTVGEPSNNSQPGRPWQPFRHGFHQAVAVRCEGHGPQEQWPVSHHEDQRCEADPHPSPDPEEKVRCTATGYLAQFVGPTLMAVLADADGEVRFRPLGHRSRRCGRVALGGLHRRHEHHGVCGLRSHRQLRNDTISSSARLNGRTHAPRITRGW